MLYGKNKQDLLWGLSAYNSLWISQLCECLLRACRWQEEQSAAAMLSGLASSAIYRQTSGPSLVHLSVAPSRETAISCAACHCALRSAVPLSRVTSAYADCCCSFEESHWTEWLINDQMLATLGGPAGLSRAYYAMATLFPQAGRFQPPPSKRHCISGKRGTDCGMCNY